MYISGNLPNCTSHGPSTSTGHVRPWQNTSLPQQELVHAQLSGSTGNGVRTARRASRPRRGSACSTACGTGSEDVISPYCMSLRAPSGASSLALDALASAADRLFELRTYRFATWPGALRPRSAAVFEPAVGVEEVSGKEHTIDCRGRRWPCLAREPAAGDAGVARWMIQYQYWCQWEGEVVLVACNLPFETHDEFLTRPSLIVWWIQSNEITCQGPFESHIESARARAQEKVVLRKAWARMDRMPDTPQSDTLHPLTLPSLAARHISTRTCRVNTSPRPASIDYPLPVVPPHDRDFASRK
ncbi:hypothetical protein EDB85DRAFT_1898493 [Lactarius pseudohatsudake]|nr:hypothetical protein EDB85DRAFT_1898493 [Lactarius pseudohatsudake]